MDSRGGTPYIPFNLLFFFIYFHSLKYLILSYGKGIKGKAEGCRNTQSEQGVLSWLGWTSRRMGSAGHKHQADLCAMKASLGILRSPNRKYQ